MAIEKITPLGCSTIFFDPFLANHIIQQTNLFEEQNPKPFRIKMKPWIPLTEDELWKFIALSINMGHVVKGKLINIEATIYYFTLQYSAKP
ncbi:hypothetical protein TKK_0016154 [Trichogramma kaykai]